MKSLAWLRVVGDDYNRTREATLKLVCTSSIGATITARLFEHAFDPNANHSNIGRALNWAPLAKIPLQAEELCKVIDERISRVGYSTSASTFPELSCNITE